MKILVYGAGVIGCYLAHTLCRTGQDVTVLARGTWRDTLERDGLVIRHHLQKKRTVDRPRVAGALDAAEHYDAIFAVMQHQQMEAILPELARANCPLVVLVGNNMSAVEMERTIQEHACGPKRVLFGFQGTGGRRENGEVVCVRFGGGSMSIGGLHSEPDGAVREQIAGLFSGSKYRLTWVRDMDAWYRCHLAFILPICYLSYRLDCDLTRVSRSQLKQAMDAIREGYGLLSALGYPILPEGSVEELTGVKGRLFYAMLWVMAKTALGRLAATDHCRHAAAEMEDLDRAWSTMRRERPDFPMPSWDAVRQAMPDWTSLCGRYF